MNNENKILTDSYFVFCIDVTSGMTPWLEQTKREINSILENYERLVLEGCFSGDGPHNFMSIVTKFRFVLFDDKLVEQSCVFDLSDKAKPWLKYIDAIKIKSDAETSDAVSAIYRATVDINSAYATLPNFTRQYCSHYGHGAVVVFANSKAVPPKSLKSADGEETSLLDLIKREWIYNGLEARTLRYKSRKILFLRSYDRDATKEPYFTSRDLLYGVLTGKDDYSNDNQICSNLVQALYWCD